MRVCFASRKQQRQKDGSDPFGGDVAVAVSVAAGGVAGSVAGGDAIAWRDRREGGRYCRLSI